MVSAAARGRSSGASSETLPAPKPAALSQAATHSGHFGSSSKPAMPPNDEAVPLNRIPLPLAPSHAVWVQLTEFFPGPWAPGFVATATIFCSFMADAFFRSGLSRPRLITPLTAALGVTRVA
jgi:hypothetical protein